MKRIKTPIVKISSKDLFDNPFINFKESSSVKDHAYDNLSSLMGKVGYHSDSYVKDDEDYSKW